MFSSTPVSASPSPTPSRGRSPVEVDVDGEYHLNAGSEFENPSAVSLVL